ncbi:hypothetical protein HY642_02635 [Candidatus Woesearchaeota archaeon]|nr:hypothetical protein [Candidatus Woesearchaeota archaeon]
MKRTLAIVIFALFAMPVAANGGCMQLAGPYRVQLSSAPLAPFLGEQASWLISFADDQGIINETVNASLQITKVGHTVATMDWSVVEPVWQVKRTFESPGHHDIIVRFTTPGHPEPLEAEFTYEVKERGAAGVAAHWLIAAGIIIGLVSSWLWNRMRR